MSSSAGPGAARDRFRALIAAAVFLLLGLVVWFATRTPGGAIDLFETGHWLAPASDMLAGKTPYRETFPLHGFLADGGMDFFLFSLFGPRLSVSLFVHHLLSALLNPLLFLTAAAATRSPVLALLVIPLNVGVSTAIASDRLVLPVLALALFVWSIGDRPRRGRALLAGIAAALGFLYSLDFGVFVLGAELATLSVVWILQRRGRSPSPIRTRAFLAGAAGVLVLFAGFLLAKGALGEFLKVSFVDLPRHMPSIWGIRFPAPSEVLPLWLKGEKLKVGEIAVGPAIGKRFYLAPLFGGFGVVVAGFCLWRRERSVEALRVLAISLASLLFYRHVVARYHVAAGNSLAGSAYFCSLVLLSRTFAGGRRRRTAIVGVVAGTALVAIAMNGPKRTVDVIRGAIAYPARMRDPIGLVPLSRGPRGDVLVPPEQAVEFQELERFCSDRADTRREILDLSNRPAVYFLLERRNPTRFYQSPIMAPFQDEVIRDLERFPPAFVVLTSGTWLDAIDGRSNADRIPAVWRFVDRAYPVRVRVGRTEIALPAKWR